ncbi:MAG TPA: PAS domain S-box protein, partial [Opitutaceae bacterium]|nr:PAS domain S-box protein [Opitutaceae bacterium]
MNTPRPSMRLLHTHFLPGLPRAAQWTFGVALVLLALGAPHTLYPTPWARTTALYVGASGLILLLLATVRVSRHLRETEALQKRTEVARQRFARVVEQTSEIVFITDARGTIDYVNHACEEATGYRAAELLGHKPSLFKSGLHDADFYLHLWGTLLGGHIFTAVFANRRKNGEIYYEEKSIAPIRDERGQIAHFVSTGRDITARHLAESALTKNEERLRIATLQTGQCIYDHAIGPGVIRWIGATRELLGRTLGELADHDLADWTALIHPDDREDYTRRLHETQQAGGRYAFEYRITRKDGSILFVADRGAVLCDEQGHPLRRIGAILDISERKRFEAELHQAKDELELRVQERSAEVIASERRFRAIFENSGTAIAYSDRAGIVQFVNQAFCELVGYSHEELACQHTGKFTHPADLLAEVPMLQEINTGKRDHYRVEKRFLTKDGITRWIDLSVAVIRDDRNTPLHLVSTALDITARKAIDRREQQLRTSLERLARGSPLTSVLAEIVRAIEEESPGARGAIFLTSPERDCLQIGAAPSLPHAFSRAIEGTPIDTAHGVSASAAASCRRIIAEDLHSYPLPETIRDATDRASLRSAWAEPVLATDGQVIGVFTIFHH